MDPGPAQWDLDSDEIGSVASEDLHRHRPNRWTGPKSTWRTFTEEDRLLWHSMKQLRDQDLAVHLYNAFALKKRGKDPATAQDLMIKTEDGQDVVWAPPKPWTAWPLKERQVPKSRLIDHQSDEDERFTFKKPEQTLPSTELEEELSATILRIAKDRCMKRMTKQVQPSIEDTPRSGSEAFLSSPPAMSLQYGSDGDDGKMHIDEATSTPTRGGTRTGKQDYAPMVTTNDDLSYKLLKQPTRHILSQLDNALSILRNSRIAGVSYLSDSSTEDESDSQATEKRRRGRPRMSHDSETDAATTPEKSSKRGRPRKVHVPRDGETLEEMHLRIARESHRKLPAVPRDKEAEFEAWLREGPEIERQRSLSLQRGDMEGLETEGDEDEAAKTANGRKVARWGLRDWSDVLGAAAVAGFSDDVIARTARRCASLFGEGMVMTRMNEVPASRGTGIQSTEYRPEPIRLSDAESDVDDESEGMSLAQRRVASRQASLARSSRDVSSDESRGRKSPHSRSRTGTPAPARSRSGSLSSTNMSFCPVPTCERAARGFSRKSNFKRHMERVHQGQAEDLDSEDEVAGAVHVDGFLRTIAPRQGWRGEDMMARKRKRGRGDVEGGGALRSRAATEEREDWD